MQLIRLFVTVLMDLIFTESEDKELTSLIIGSWQYEYWIWEFKSDGTWCGMVKHPGRDEILESKAGGKFCIESEILYIESEKTEEAWMYPIAMVNSQELILLICTWESENDWYEERWVKTV